MGVTIPRFLLEAGDSLDLGLDIRGAVESLNFGETRDRIVQDFQRTVVPNITSPFSGLSPGAELQQSSGPTPLSPAASPTPMRDDWSQPSSTPSGGTAAPILPSFAQRQEGFGGSPNSGFGPSDFDGGNFELSDTRQIAPQFYDEPEPAPTQTFGPPERDDYRKTAPDAQGGMSTDIETYIRQAAEQRGIDPNIAVKVANTEGGVTEAARRGTFSTGSSWWPFQLHYGGKGYEHLGDTAGMGNTFTERTGFAPGDPAAVYASIDYALDHAKNNGWGAWYGAKAIGITGKQGINDEPPQTSPAAGRPAPKPPGQLGPAGDYDSSDIEHINQVALASPTKWSECGPVAAVMAALRRGKAWTVEEAKNAAAAMDLWSADMGMRGLGAEVKLLNSMGMTAATGPAEERALIEDTTNGNTPIISTNKHYYILDGYDPATGKFDTVTTGPTMKGGKRWMSLDEIAAQGGGIQGAAFIDNPRTDKPSIVSDAYWEQGGPATRATAAEAVEPDPLTGEPPKHGLTVSPDERNEWQDLFNSFSSGIEAIDEQLAHGRDNVQKFVSEVGGGVGDLLGGAGAAVGGAADRLGTEFRDRLDQGAADVGGAAANVGSTFDQLGSGLRGGLDQAGEAIGGRFDELGTAARGRLDQDAADLGQATTSIGDTFSQAGTTVRNRLDQDVADLDRLGGDIQNLQTFAAQKSNELAGALNASSDTLATWVNDQAAAPLSIPDRAVAAAQETIRQLDTLVTQEAEKARTGTNPNERIAVEMFDTIGTHIRRAREAQAKGDTQGMVAETLKATVAASPRGMSAQIVTGVAGDAAAQFGGDTTNQRAARGGMVNVEPGEVDKTLDDATARSNALQRGLQNAKSGILEGLAIGGRALDPDGDSQFARFVENEADKTRTYLNEHPEILRRRGVGATGEEGNFGDAMIEALPAMAGTVIGGGLGVAATVLGTRRGGAAVGALGTVVGKAQLPILGVMAAGSARESMEDLVQDGKLSPEMADTLSGLAGVVEVATERLGVEQLVGAGATRIAARQAAEIAAQGVIKRGFGTVTRDTAQAAVAEGLEEVIAQEYGNAVRIIAGDERTDWGTGVVDAFLLGGTMGGVMSGAMGAAELGADRAGPAARAAVGAVDRGLTAATESPAMQRIVRPEGGTSLGMGAGALAGYTAGPRTSPEGETIDYQRSPDETPAGPAESAEMGRGPGGIPREAMREGPKGEAAKRAWQSVKGPVTRVLNQKAAQMRPQADPPIVKVGNEPPRRSTRLEPPEGFARPGELTRSSEADLPNREVFERVAKKFPEVRMVDGGYLLPNDKAARWELIDKLIRPNDRMPPGLENPEMEAFLGNLNRVREGIGTGETQPETMILAALLSMGSIKRAGSSATGAIQRISNIRGEPLAGEELAARVQPNIYPQAKGGGQERGILMRPEILWSMVAGDTTRPEMMKMLAGMTRAGQFSSEEAREAAVEQGVRQLYSEVSGPGSGFGGANNDVQNILGLNYMVKGEEIQSQTPGWTQTEGKRWTDLVDAVLKRGPYTGTTGEDARKKQVTRQLRLSPRGIGQVKTRFNQAMGGFPEYATLDTRMLRDVFGISPKVGSLSTDEYERLSERLWELEPNSKYLYGAQWLPWEFLTGERVNYDSLIGTYDRVNSFMRRANDMASRQKIPLDQAIDQLAATEQRVNLTLADPAQVEGRIGLSGDALRALPPGAGIGQVQKAVPELFRLIRDAGLEVVNRPSTATGGWMGEATTEVPDGRYVEGSLDLVLRGPKPALRWFAAASLFVSPGEQAVYVGYTGAGSTNQHAVGTFTIKGVDRAEQPDFVQRLLDVVPDGVTVRTGTVRTAKGDLIVEIGSQESAEVVQATLEKALVTLATAGYTVSDLAVTPAEVEFIARADAEAIVRGGPKGVSVNGPGTDVGGTAPNLLDATNGGGDRAPPGAVREDAGGSGAPAAAGTDLDRAGGTAAGGAAPGVTTAPTDTPAPPAGPPAGGAGRSLVDELRDTLRNEMGTIAGEIRTQLRQELLGGSAAAPAAAGRPNNDLRALPDETIQQFRTRLHQKYGVANTAEDYPRLLEEITEGERQELMRMRREIDDVLDAPPSGQPLPPTPAAPTGPQPRAARGASGSGTATIGFSPDFFLKEINSRYPDDKGAISVKEMVQNAVDATSAQIATGKTTDTPLTRILIDQRTREFGVWDQGTGMVSEVLENEFVKFGGSLKGDNARGGFGTAKIAILGNAEKIALVSVAERWTVTTPAGEYYAAATEQLAQAWLDKPENASVRRLNPTVQNEGVFVSVAHGNAEDYVNPEKGLTTRFARWEVRQELLDDMSIPLEVRDAIGGWRVQGETVPPVASAAEAEAPESRNLPTGWKIDRLLEANENDYGDWMNNVAGAQDTDWALFDQNGQVVTTDRAVGGRGRTRAQAESIFTDYFKGFGSATRQGQQFARAMAEKQKAQSRGPQPQPIRQANGLPRGWTVRQMRDLSPADQADMRSEGFVPDAWILRTGDGDAISSLPGEAARNAGEAAEQIRRRPGIATAIENELQVLAQEYKMPKGWRLAQLDNMAAEDRGAVFDYANNLLAMQPEDLDGRDWFLLDENNTVIFHGSFMPSEATAGARHREAAWANVIDSLDEIDDYHTEAADTLRDNYEGTRAEPESTEPVYTVPEDWTFARLSDLDENARREVQAQVEDPSFIDERDWYLLDHRNQLLWQVPWTAGMVSNPAATRESAWGYVLENLDALDADGRSGDEIRATAQTAAAPQQTPGPRQPADPNAPPQVGTYLGIQLRKDARFSAHPTSWDAAPYRKWIDGFLASSKLNDQRVEFYDNGGRIAAPTNPEDTADQKLTTLTVPGAQVDIWISKAYHSAPRLRVNYLNNGLPQTTGTVELNESTNVPKTIVVDVRSTVPAGSPNYPWSADRQRLVQDAATSVDVYLTREIAEAAKRAESKALHKALDSGYTVPRAQGKLLDTTAAIPVDVMNRWRQQPWMRLMMNGAARGHDALTKMTEGKPNEFDDSSFRGSEWLGFGTSRGWVGLNIDTISIGKSQKYSILLNPWLLLQESVNKVRREHGSLYAAPKGELEGVISRRMAAVLTHEVIHNSPGGRNTDHGAAFAGIQTRMGVELATHPDVIGPIRKAVRQMLADPVNLDQALDSRNEWEGYATSQNALGKIGLEERSNDAEPEGDRGDVGGVPAGVDGPAAARGGGGVPRGGVEPGAGPAGDVGDGATGTDRDSAVPGAGTERPERDDPFHSRLRRAISGVRESSFPANILLRRLESGSLPSPFSRAEVVWTGLDDYLRSRGTDTLRKDDLLAWLDDHAIRVEETVLEDRDEQDEDPDTGPTELTEAADRLRTYLEENMESILADTWLAPDARSRLERIIDDAMYADNVDLPTVLRNGSATLRLVENNELHDWLDAFELVDTPENRPQYGAGRAIYGPEGQHGPELVEPGGRNYRELLLRLPPLSTPEVTERYDAMPGEPSQMSEFGPDDYQSTHWPNDANVLAHVRFDERTRETPNGEERVLFIQEFQSDWALDVLKSGVRGTTDPITRLRAMGYTVEFDGGGVTVTDPATNQRLITPDDMAMFGQARSTEIEAPPEVAALIAEAYDMTETRGGGMPPPAGPFVVNPTKTGASGDWIDLGVKRMVRWAVEHGFDRLAWTSGEQQINRYHLETMADRLDLVTRPDGTERLEVYRNRTFQKAIPLNQPDAEGEGGSLESMVGPEIAARLRAQPPSGTTGTTQPLESQTRVLNLTEQVGVGGRGKRKLYDEMVPSAVKRVMKKFGIRDQPIEMPFPESAGAGISGDADLNHVVMDPNNTIYDAFSTLGEAERVAADAGPGYYVASTDRVKQEQVHSVPITDEVRESVLGKGWPLMGIVGGIGIENQQFLRDTIGAGGDDEEDPETFSGMGAVAGMALFSGRKGGGKFMRAAMRSQKAAAGAQRPAPPVFGQPEVAEEDRPRGVTPLDWIKQVGYSGMIGPTAFVTNTAGNAIETFYNLPKQSLLLATRTGEASTLIAPTAAIPGAVISAGAEFLRTLGRGSTHGGNVNQALSDRLSNPVAKAAATFLEVGGRLFTEAPDMAQRRFVDIWGREVAAAYAAAAEGNRGMALVGRGREIARQSREDKDDPNALLRGVHSDEVNAVTQRLTDLMSFRGPMGSKGEQVKKFLNPTSDKAFDQAIGMALHLAVPFFATLYHLGARGAERTPGLGVFAATPADEKVYDQLVGGLITAGIVGLAMGGLLTGSGPDDPEKQRMEAALGRKNNSILLPIPGIGPTYVPNAMMGVWGPHLNLAGEIADAFRYSEGKQAENMTLTLLGRVGKVGADLYYMRGLTDIVSTLLKPELELENFIAGQFTRLEPYAATGRSVAQISDPYERSTDRKAGLGERIKGEVQRTIPGWVPGIPNRQNLRQATDVLGNPVRNIRQNLPPGLPSIGRPRRDPVIEEFRRSGIDIGNPPKSIQIDMGSDQADVPLTEREADLYKMIMGEYIQENFSSASDGYGDDEIPERLRRLSTRARAAAARAIKESWTEEDVRRRTLAGAR
jgi:hypothetical protein